MPEAPRLISALLPVKESEPMLKSLSLENVSALSAVTLPTDHAASEVTLTLLLSCRLSTRSPEAEPAPDPEAGAEPAPEPDPEAGAEPEDDGAGDTKPTGPDPALVDQVTNAVMAQVMDMLQSAADEHDAKQDQEIKLANLK